MASIVVLGAGVVGMSTAVRIQDTLPGAKVTIMADKLYDETTSYGAGGIFRPQYSKNPEVPKDKLKHWLRLSWDYYMKLAWSPKGGAAGVTRISGYHLWKDANAAELPITKDFTTDFRWLTKQEMTLFPAHFTFKSRGGVFIKRHVKALSELTRNYDVIVNCAALGNRELVKDKLMIPVRGYLIRVNAPWLKHFIYTDEDCHLIPGAKDVIVGGVKQYGDSDTLPRLAEHECMIQRAIRIYPPLKGADLNSVKTWVGFRPYRPAVRLEMESIYSGFKRIPVIHNYGHGAEGVSLSWGTATEAAGLVKTAIGMLGPHQSRL